MDVLAVKNQTWLEDMNREVAPAIKAFNKRSLQDKELADALEKVHAAITEEMRKLYPDVKMIRMYTFPATLEYDPASLE